MNGPNNAIGWCDYTWNPITGCLHGCTFGPNKVKCYAEVIAHRLNGSPAFPNGFAPTFHPNRLADPIKIAAPQRIFVGSMTDIFGEWVKPEWLDRIMQTVRDCPQHTFQFLTKNPLRVVRDFKAMPPNVWVGSTITGERGGDNRFLDLVRKFPSAVRFVSCEPLCGLVEIERAEPNWVIIGAATGAGAFQPEPEWRARIEIWCRTNGVPIFHKENLRIKKRRMEWPRGQAHSEILSPLRLL